MTISLETVSPLNNEAMLHITQLLKKSGLRPDSRIEFFISAYDDQQLVACVGLDEDVVKCFAVDDAYRGQGVGALLMAEMLSKAAELGRGDLFVCTKPNNVPLFRGCGFFPLVDIPGTAVFMENSSTRLGNYCRRLAKHRKPGRVIGSIVMNANPFTKGHRYLVEYAAKHCDWVHVFVVKSENPYFSYSDRFALVKENSADLTNVSVHEGSKYIVSRVTFPNYFLPEGADVTGIHAEIDLRLFRDHIAPALGITHRFVGTEPLSGKTKRYNEEMKHVFSEQQHSSPPISVVEIDRLSANPDVISATRVRNLLFSEDRKLREEINWDEVAAIVPTTTLVRLKNMHDCAR